jgi:hypothetical protein
LDRVFRDAKQGGLREGMKFLVCYVLAATVLCVYEGLLSSKWYLDHGKAMQGFGFLELLTGFLKMPSKVRFLRVSDMQLVMWLCYVCVQNRK